MWNKKGYIQTPLQLMVLLGQLEQAPEPFIFSFENNNITYLTSINNYKEYPKELIFKSEHIKVWEKIEKE